jgi:chromosome segregation ATPase
MITKDKEGNLLLSDSAPEKAYQDSQKVTEKLTAQAEKIGRLEAENKALETNSKKITVTLKEGNSKLDRAILTNMMYGLMPIEPGNVSSIKVDNVDDVDKFLTKVLESDISNERDELKTKYEKLEAKLDEKDREIVKSNRTITSLKDKHADAIDDLDNSYSKEITQVRKTAKSKFEKQLLDKDVEIAQLNNAAAISAQEANLREIDLLGKLKVYEEANTVLEKRVEELGTKRPTLLGNLGNYINKMNAYKKALRKVESFRRRNRKGSFGYCWDF